MKIIMGFWVITIPLLIITYFLLICNKSGNILNLGIALLSGLILILYSEFMKSNKHWITEGIKKIINSFKKD